MTPQIIKPGADHDRKDVGPDLLSGHGRQQRAAIIGEPAQSGDEQTGDIIRKTHRDRDWNCKGEAANGRRFRGARP